MNLSTLQNLFYCFEMRSFSLADCSEAKGFFCAGFSFLNYMSFSFYIYASFMYILIYSYI